MFPVFFQCRNAMVDISKVILNKVDLQAQVSTTISVASKWSIKLRNFCNNQVKQLQQEDIFMDGWAGLGSVRYCAQEFKYQKLQV